MQFYVKQSLTYQQTWLNAHKTAYLCTHVFVLEFSLTIYNKVIRQDNNNNTNEIHVCSLMCDWRI